MAKAPGYVPNPDPLMWRRQEREILTGSLVDFTPHRRRMRPLVNFYVTGEGCRDPEALAVYRREILESIELLKAYRDWFTANYPQFSYLDKLRFQLSDGPVERVLNIPTTIIQGFVTTSPAGLSSWGMLV